MDRFEEERAILDKLSKVLKNVESVAGALGEENRRDGVAVSYTHLTLPTICSV